LPFGKLEDYLENVKKPFCVFIASDFPHGPYPKLSDYEKKDIYQLPYDKGDFKNFKIGYYQNIKDDNSQLEHVLKIIETNHLVGNSIFIYASDHGISGKWTVAEQGLKVPFIVRWPGVVEPNSTSETMLNFVDILPTFLDITGAKIPNNLDGKSFKPILQGSKKPIHKYLYSLATMQNIQNCKVFPSRAVRDKRFKLVRNYNSMEVMASNFGPNPVVNQFIRIGSESFPNVPYEELYDLKVDPYQQNNLINKPEFMDIKNRLSLALKNWMIAQDDFLIHEKMPLIKPTLHPLDRNSKWNKVSMDLVNKLNENDYTEAHY
ncbi:sulfatase-like hydrolase/transferase, partial [Winogradskyella sp.]